MLWRLKRKLANIERRAQPDEALKLEMKKFFQDKGYFARETSPVASSRHFSALQFAAVALVIVLLVTVGASSYAYASDDVLPDSILYPVKETIENLEEHLAVTDAQKKEVLVRHQERRLQEAKMLIDQQKPLPVLHKALLLEVKKEEQEKAEGKQIKDDTLPLVKVRLELEAKEALMRKQRQAEHDVQRKREQEKRAAEKEAAQDHQEERRKQVEEDQQKEQEDAVLQDDDAKTPEEIKAEAEIKWSDRSIEEKQKLLLELRDKRRTQRALQEERRQEMIRIRQKEQEAKKRLLEEQKKAEIEKREIELKAEEDQKREAELKADAGLNAKVEGEPQKLVQ